MPVRTGRISFILIAAVICAALIASCQAQVTPSGPAGGYPAVNQPVETVAYPAGAGATLAVAPVATAYPEEASSPTQPAGENPGPAGMPAAPNQANVVAQLLEQRTGENADQVILHVKLLSAEPQPGSTDFVTQLVNQEVDLVASAAGLPQLAANDQFEAVVSLMGDEKSQQYSANEIKKK